MTTRATFVLAVLALAGCGQERLDTRTFRITNLQPGDVEVLIQPYVYDDRPEAPGTFSTGVNAVTVRETEDNLDRIGRVLAEYDVQAPLTQLRFQLIAGNGGEGSDPAIAEVEPELRRLFRFPGYRLLGEAAVSARSGSDVKQEFQGTTGRWAVQVRVSRPQQGTVLLQDLQLYGPGWDLGERRAEPRLQTSVNIPDGQTVVLGSARDERGGAIFLTVRAEPGQVAAAPPAP